ncbi:ECF RNA polymerase sigma factor SigX [Thalassocella blandensis]|nr:ECF RNA polymerase sigma factor SigX [Thalassocella blandensis]
MPEKVIHLQQHRDTQDRRNVMDDFLASVEQRAFKTALLSTKNRDEALDIVQDAMIKLVQKYSEHKSDQWPLLFQRILQHCIIDWVRAQQRTSRWFWRSANEDLEEDVLAQESAHKDDNPVDILHRYRDVNEVYNVLQNLPVRQRQAFLLRAWEGFDVSSTAKAMECSEGSVKTHYHRAITALREGLTT